MIYVRIELWPQGDASKKHVLAEGTISNDGTGTPAYGNYDVSLGNRAGRFWKRGRVENFPRNRLSPWDLLYRAIRASVGERT